MKSDTEGVEIVAPGGGARAPYIHVHAPQPDSFGLRRFDCPTCKRPSWEMWTHTPWYGIDCTCLRCGEQWGSEGRFPRPFAPKWRQRNIEAARKQWKRLKARAASPEGMGKDAQQ